jgi:broad specificity phosphatase PhoE
MTNYYIFRHGQTYNSKNRVKYPKNNFKVEILPEGIPDLEKIAIYLKNIPSDYNVSSEYLRCRQTSEIVTKIAGKIFEKDSRINEFSQKFGQESFEIFKERIKSFLDDLEAKKYNTVVICTHGAVIAGLKSFLLKNTFVGDDLTDYPRPGVLLCVKNKKIEELDFR